MSADRKAWLAQHEALQSAADPDARAMIEAMKSQLLLVLIGRLGGNVRVPVAEVDGTGGLLLNMQVDGTDFVFTLERKQ